MQMYKSFLIGKKEKKVTVLFPYKEGYNGYKLMVIHQRLKYYLLKELLSYYLQKRQR